MSKHEFTLRVDVDAAQLAEYNERAHPVYGPITIPSDPSEWGDSDLQVALDEGLMTYEIIDYRVSEMVR